MSEKNEKPPRRLPACAICGEGADALYHGVLCASPVAEITTALGAGIGPFCLACVEALKQLGMIEDTREHEEEI